VTDLTPEQEALYALGWNLQRSDLSPAAQLEYARFKPGWEHGGTRREEEVRARLHTMDRSGTTHTLRSLRGFHAGPVSSLWPDICLGRSS
jgi:hypothetical protein